MQKANKQRPERSCLGCGIAYDKNDLIRVVRTADGKICIDKTGRLNGRGAYICKNPDCLKKALKSKKIDRSLKVTLPEEIYHDLENEVIGIGSNEA